MGNLYKEVADIIKNSNNIVFFGGAGVSTECGIPDFRSKNGLYNQKYKFKYSPEEILSYTFFIEHPDIFYQYLRENLIKENISPNKGHKALAQLEKIGKLKAVITQNIDNLHQEAGSLNVIELHGTMWKFYCTKCNHYYSLDYIKSTTGVPHCECGGIIRPDIVLYEEPLDDIILQKSINYIKNADVLIVAGTSLLVYPAAGLLKFFNGSKMIIINRDKTAYDGLSDIVINKPFARTMMNVMLELGIWDFKTKIIENHPEDYINHPSFNGIKFSPIIKPEDKLGIKSQYVKIPSNGEIPPHTHEVVELIVVIQGNPHILINGDWIQVECGTTISAYPGEIHGVRNNTPDDVIIVANFKS